MQPLSPLYLTKTNKQTPHPQQRDVQRNGLVSVFLRILEYYSGILFLTTNRVGAMDDAFRSRLHLTLYYPKLTRKQTTKIFERNFKRIAELNADRTANGLIPFEYASCERKVMAWASEKEKWKELRWNGRQIRNTFQTALALAEFQSKGPGTEIKKLKVSLRHFEIVANASTEFNKYLKAVHGFDEDRVAKRDLIRAAEYSPSTPKLYPGKEDFSDSSSDSDDSSDDVKTKKGKKKAASSDESDSGSGSDSSSESEAEKKKKAKKKSKDKKGASTEKKSKKTEGKGKSEKDKKNDKKDGDETDSSE